MNRVAILGLLDLDLECTGTGELRLATDLPATGTPAAGSLPAGWAVRETKAIPTTGRRVLRFRLQGTTKGRLYTLRVAPVGNAVIRLFGAKIWARVLPAPTWDWYTVPIPPTSEEWTAVKLDIPPTGDWTPSKLPIPETGDWAPSKLPIPETGDWAPSKLPIPETGQWEPSKLPIPETGDWAPSKLPIKPTPDNPQWVEIAVDE